MVTASLIRKHWTHASDLAIGFANDELASRRDGAAAGASPTALPDWLGSAVATTADPDGATDLPDRRVLVTEARRLATEVRRLFDAVTSGQQIREETIFIINRALGMGPQTSRLVVVAGAPTVETDGKSDNRLAILAPIALAAAELVAHADPKRLRRCAAMECGRWFLDTSKGGRRRWCSMARCGNRSKAARYRRRHASAD